MPRFITWYHAPAYSILSGQRAFFLSHHHSNVNGRLPLHNNRDGLAAEIIGMIVTCMV
jgi:hypothetical protein